MASNNLTMEKKYGQLLFDMAKEQNSIDEIYAELETLREVFQEVPEIGRILSDERLEPFEKIDILRELERDFGETVVKFMRVMYEYGRMNELPAIINEFEVVYFDNKGILIADVTTAIPLTSNQVTKLEEQLAKLYGYQSVRLREVVDPEIIGGLIVSANHRLIDKSIRKQLQDMHRELSK